jgi:hypothetical protein
MVASAAATLYRVVTVKRGEVTLVAVDGGMGDNLEVALFDQRFEAGIVDRLDAAGGETVTLVGRHCESGDVLVEDVRLAAPRVGDLIAVPATGAYCYTMANNYNGNRRIPVVFVADGEARLRRRGRPRAAAPPPRCAALRRAGRSGRSPRALRRLTTSSMSPARRRSAPTDSPSPTTKTTVACIGSSTWTS